jgi:hypothetical protein
LFAVPSRSTLFQKVPKLLEGCQEGYQQEISCKFSKNPVKSRDKKKL